MSGWVDEVSTNGIKLSDDCPPFCCQQIDFVQQTNEKKEAWTAGKSMSLCCTSSSVFELPCATHLLSLSSDS